MEQLPFPDCGSIQLTGPSLSTDARATIAQLRASGDGWTKIARELNASGVPTPSGTGQWYPTSVYRHTTGRAGWNQYMRNYRSKV